MMLIKPLNGAPLTAYGALHLILILVSMLKILLCLSLIILPFQLWTTFTYQTPVFFFRIDNHFCGSRVGGERIAQVSRMMLMCQQKSIKKYHHVTIGMIFSLIASIPSMCLAKPWLYHPRASLQTSLQKKNIQLLSLEKVKNSLEL